MNILEKIKQFFFPIFYSRKIIIEEVPERIILEEPKPEDWVFGGETEMGAEAPLIPSGQYLSYWQQLFYDELQKKAFETFSCTNNATLNCNELIAFIKFFTKRNWSERYNAKKSGTGPNGNSFSNPAESLRKDGCPSEEVWPFTDTMTREEYFKEPPVEVNAKAQELLKEFKFNHEFVPFSIANFKEALKYSPLGIGVYGWARQGDIYIMPSGATHNHMVMLIGYEEGKHWLIADSYEPFIKKLDWNYRFYPYAKKYRVEKVVGNTEGEKLYQRFLGKPILLTEEINNYEPGAYEVGQGYFSRVVVIISNKKMADVAQQAWRDNRTMTGINGANFLLLASYMQEAFGKAEVRSPDPVSMGELLMSN